MVIFYPTISYRELGKYADAVTVCMLPVSSWAGAQLKRQEARGLSTAQVQGTILTPKLPASVCEVAADCGGFVATRKWGDYRYSPEQYVTWLHSLVPRLSWAATMDYCCENEITSGKSGIVRMRQDATTDMAQHFWATYHAVPWVWVPTIQGWEVEDYERHARELKPLIEEMHAQYSPGSAFRVGIGTLCARASTEMIQRVILAVTALLPGVPLHLWGVKLGLAKSLLALPSHVVSVDSGAWNGMFGHGRDLWKLARKADGTPYRQTEWCLKVALPEYTAKVQTNLASLKQARLF